MALKTPFDDFNPALLVFTGAGIMLTALVCMVKFVRPAYTKFSQSRPWLRTILRYLFALFLFVLGWSVASWALTPWIVQANAEKMVSRVIDAEPAACVHREVIQKMIERWGRDAVENTLKTKCGNV